MRKNKLGAGQSLTKEEIARRIELDKQAIVKLSQIIKTEPDSKTFQKIHQALNHAALLQQSSDRYIHDKDNELTYSDLIEQLDLIESSLSQIKLAINYMSFGQEKRLDDHFTMESDRDLNRLALSDPDDIQTSQFSLVIDNMQKTIDSYKNDFPPQRSGNKTDQRYTLALLHIAKHFETLLPNRNISNKPRSWFSRLIQLWLVYYLYGEEKSMSNQISTLITTLEINKEEAKKAKS